MKGSLTGQFSVIGEDTVVFKDPYNYGLKTGDIEDAISDLMINENDLDPIAIIAHKTYSIVIKKVSLKSVTIDQALDFLRQKSKEFDSDKKRVNFYVVIRPGSHVNNLITIELEECRLRQLMELICASSSFSYQIKSDGIHFYVP